MVRFVWDKYRCMWLDGRSYKGVLFSGYGVELSEG